MLLVVAGVLGLFQVVRAEVPMEGVLGLPVLLDVAYVVRQALVAVLVGVHQDGVAGVGVGHARCIVAVVAPLA